MASYSTGAGNMWEENMMLMAQIRRMKSEHQLEIQTLNEQHKAMLLTYIAEQKKYYEKKSSTEVYNLKLEVESLKLKHAQELLNTKQRHDKAKADAVASAIKKCQLASNQVIDRIKSDYALQISDLKKQYNELRGQFVNSEFNLMKSNELIASMKKLHAKALADEKAVLSKTKAQAQEIQDSIDDKKARNKKLAMGGAGIISAYLMFKE